MRREIQSQEDLNHEESARLVLDYIHRMMMHHAMWYAEVRHQLGREKAERVLATVYERSSGIQLKRLATTLGFKMQGDIPHPLLGLSKEALSLLKENLALNWLANDGVWFQAVESVEPGKATLCRSCQEIPGRGHGTGVTVVRILRQRNSLLWICRKRHDVRVDIRREVASTRFPER